MVDILLPGGGIGVALFVLISGYFMVESRFSGKKLLRILIQTGTISLGLYLFFRYIPQEGIQPHESILTMVAEILPLAVGKYWFLTAYILLMLLSPVLNMVIRNSGRAELRRLVTVLAIFCCCTPYTVEIVGNIGSFILLYILAGYMRLHGRTPRGNTAWYLAAALLALAAMDTLLAVSCGADSLFMQNLHRTCAAKFGIFSLLVSILLFRAFLGMNLGSSKWINSIAACTLGVYLIHDNNYMRPFLWRNIFHCRDMLAQGPAAIWWHCITTVPAVYIGCTILAFIWKQTVERAYISWVEPRLLPVLRRAGGYATGGLDRFCKRYIDRD